MVKITFKPTSDNTFEETFDLATTTTVQQIRAAVGKRLSVGEDKIKLIHKGKILKDEQLLSTMGLGEVETFHLVVKKEEPVGGAGGQSVGGDSTSGQQGQQGFGGMGGGFGGMGGMGGMGGFGGGMGGMGGMGGGFGGLGGMNPNDLAGMMSNLDPQMMQQMVQNNPMLKAMASSNPQIQAILSNPEMLKQMMSPEMISMALSQLGSGGLGGMMGGMGGGGFGNFGGQNTNTTAPTQQNTGMPDINQMMNFMGGLGGNTTAQQPPGTPPLIQLALTSKPSTKTNSNSLWIWDSQMSQ